jgi:exodeoxyribonuclease V alpha subunit
MKKKLKEKLKESIPERRLSLEQQHAVEVCCDLKNTIAGITGGAGTGKTLVLGHVYRQLVGLGIKTVLAAPTGRAAKRVQELTGIPAKTIHRLLEFPMPDDPDDTPVELMNEPRRNRMMPLEERVVIVDESSMIGPTLHGQLMDALRKDGAIRFFGDNNQLPPVEEGTPPFIETLLKFPAVELMYNFRSDDAIVSNAMRILQSKIPFRNDRFVIIYDENPLAYMLNMTRGLKDFADDSHQIIMPTRRGKYGTMRINPSLQLRFNGKGPLLLLERYDPKEPKLAVRKGDKFLWIKNDYKLNMFNGELGRIAGLDAEDGELTLKTSDRAGDVIVPARLTTYSPYHKTVIQYDPRKQIELGYAITTHKAQGSEFDTVIYCIARGHSWLLNKRNFYTAVTRAKNKVIIISDKRAMGLSMGAPRRSD